MTKHRCLVTTLVLALSSFLPGPAVAYPTCLNMVPTADVMAPGSFSVQFEIDGDPTPFARGGSYHALTQFGITPGLEIGLDRLDLNGETHWSADAKWQFVRETARRPAAAVGVTSLLHRGADTQWYAALSKDVGRGALRLTGGLAHDASSRGLVGAELAVSATSAVLTDWSTGSGGYATVGLARDLGPATSVLLYWGHSNTRGDGDFVGLNLCWQGLWR